MQQASRRISTGNPLRIGFRGGTQVTNIAAPKYVMKISRLTVDKLGVKLYDRVSAVIAELVANSYDADAAKVTITAPMDEGKHLQAPRTSNR